MITWPPNPRQIASAKAFVSALAAAGVPKIVQFALVANADYESEFDPNAKGDWFLNGVLQKWSPDPVGTPTAFGLLQHQQARLAIIRDGVPSQAIKGLGIDIFAAVMAGENTVLNEAQAVWWELETFPRYGLAAALAASTVRDATIVLCRTFEIATTSASDRGQRGEEWCHSTGDAAVSLPPLKWVPSPNFSARTARVDLLILHDMEGSYQGSIDWFQRSDVPNPVSCHFCLREDGLEATQMVHLADKAWHVCAFNSRAVGLEMAGFAKRGYQPPELAGAAEIMAYLASHLQIPIRHARGGVGPGIESHWGLGADGGGHSDPSTVPAFMDTFVAAVQAAFNRHDFPTTWDVDDPKPAACSLTPKGPQ